MELATEPAGLVRAANVFLACEDSEKIEFFEMQTCLEPGAQMFFRHKHLHLNTKNLQLPAKIPATAGNNTRNCKQSAIRPRVSSHA